MEFETLHPAANLWPPPPSFDAISLIIYFPLDLKLTLKEPFDCSVKRNETSTFSIARKNSVKPSISSKKDLVSANALLSITAE